MESHTPHVRLWHRCGTCGMLASSIPELYAHLDAHQALADRMSQSDTTQYMDLVEEGMPETRANNSMAAWKVSVVRDDIRYH